MSKVAAGLARSLALCATLVLSDGVSEGAAWLPVAVQGASPPARQHAAMAHDRSRGRVLLFGGSDSVGQPLDDTWAFDLATLSWSPLATGAAVRPPARFSMVFGIDSASQRFLITTGQDTDGFLNDAWSFHLVTHTWTQLDPPASSVPPERYGSGGGIYDPATFEQVDSQLILSHGFTFSGRFDDTWRLDPEAAIWAEDTPVGLRPLSRCLHGAAPVEGARLVIFGGCASGFGPCPLDDTWLFDVPTRTWTELSPDQAPVARLFPSMAVMGSGDGALLFGGTGPGNLNDVWRLDVATETWTPLAVSGPPPSPRHGASFVWIDDPDAALGGEGCGSALLFGGEGNSGSLSDLWALVPDTPPVLPRIYLSKGPGETVHFAWQHDPGNGTYEVWRSADPGFDAGSGTPLRLPGDAIVVGDSVSFDDHSQDEPAPLFTYRVRVASCSPL